MWYRRSPTTKDGEDTVAHQHGSHVDRIFVNLFFNFLLIGTRRFTIETDHKVTIGSP